MKIVHISISAPFIDGWGYQENLLTQYLQKAGTENYVIASATDFPNYLKPEIVNEIKAKGTDYTLCGINVRRIVTGKITTSFVYTKGLKEVLEEINPDVIFHHNFNCTSMPICARYAKHHHIPMVCDNHADSINMSNNKVWVWLYYKMLIGGACKFYKNQIYKAYGVTHSRCDFIHDYYRLSGEKIDFLPIGADVDEAETIAANDVLRNKYGFSLTDFVVVSGGKMGIGKGTDQLIMAMESLQQIYPQIKLVLFGRFEDENTAIQAECSKVTRVYGWCDRIKTLELLKLSDVACWPIHHTTLIEDAVSVCTPIINRKTGTTEHLINGNGLGVLTGTKAELEDALSKVINQSTEEKKMMQEACVKMRQLISYHTIAAKLLHDISKFKHNGFTK